LFGFGFVRGFSNEKQMTDCQKLLKEYAETGSESAFRELVGRYVNLVYSTALRLVNGQTQLAEDVSQTVFIGLARKAGALSREVMLGGWLYRHTWHVATKAARSEQRRQAREREAVEMNTLQNDPAEIARRLRPVLDEALLRLGHEDRQAILLRFFEGHDFRAVGAALNVSEDAARMKVSRAVDKLHSILTRRGVVLPAAALSAGLSMEALRAAPVGLAAKLAGGALAAPLGGGILHAAFVNLMNATKLKTGLACIIVAASVATSLVLQQRAAARIGGLDDSLRRQADRAAALSADNERLSHVLARANGSKGQLEELLKLRGEAQALREQTNQLAALREEHSRLHEQLQSWATTPLQKAEERVARVKFVMNFLHAAREFEDKYGRTPSGFKEAAPFLPKDSEAVTSPLSDNFEWVYQLPDTMAATLPTNMDSILAIREIDPTLGIDGKWNKQYGFLPGGYGQLVTVPSTWNGVTYNTFEEYEAAHIVSPAAK
jgi:RNA polymerase sigma factor (sigma-70 family)